MDANCKFSKLKLVSHLAEKQDLEWDETGRESLKVLIACGYITQLEKNTYQLLFRSNWHTAYLEQCQMEFQRETSMLNCWVCLQCLVLLFQNSNLKKVLKN